MTPLPESTAAGQPPASLPLVFVTVGTDHHPFNRLVGWIDAWLLGAGRDRARCLVQYGTSGPPAVAEGREYMEYPEMEAAVSEATAVVCHGGPGSVMTCRWLGKRPIVVPRRRHLGEHVDDHQLAFTRRMAAEGEMGLAEQEDVLHGLLEQALLRGTAERRSDATEATARSVARFEELVEAILPPDLRTAGPQR